MTGKWKHLGKEERQATGGTTIRRAGLGWSMKFKTTNHTWRKNTDKQGNQDRTRQSDWWRSNCLKLIETLWSLKHFWNCKYSGCKHWIWTEMVNARVNPSTCAASEYPPMRNMLLNTPVIKFFNLCSSLYLDSHGTVKQTWVQFKVYINSRTDQVPGNALNSLHQWGTSHPVHFIKAFFHFPILHISKHKLLPS